MSKWCVAYDGPYDDIIYRYFNSEESANEFAKTVEDKEPNIYEVTSYILDSIKRELSSVQKIKVESMSYKEKLDILADSIKESFSVFTEDLTEEQAEKAVKKYGNKLTKLSTELLKLSIAINRIK